MSERVLTYPEYLKVDKEMPYSAYLQGCVEDGLITSEEAQRLERNEL